jgi:hypothetical protein
MNALQLISILLEVLVVALGIMLVVGKKKMYGWCIALTFVLYIFYDLVDLCLCTSPRIRWTFYSSWPPYPSSGLSGTSSWRL